ncbi:Gfo/Idh/MocA family protein [Egbenema bharatensis]|uniref:Gfo/Idh/MocA family protein n=1 Tax=Egbenema bharatensis TaxID=3463334 RepID=UPI003A8BA79F
MNLIQVGLIGTGYAAKLRAEAFHADERSRLVAVAGHTLDRTQSFAETYSATVVETWEELVMRSDIDLVVIAAVNQEHGRMTRAALEAGKHVVVEYPLSLDVSEAEELIQLAASQQRLLHVEHIELLSGIHTAIQSALPHIGTPFHVRYSSLNPQRPAPPKWTYQSELFGFPFIGAVSRIHRLTDLFGSVAAVSCQTQFWRREQSSPFFQSCICAAQLRFTSGLIAEVNYGKGEAIWQAVRSLEVQGELGAIVIDREQGSLIQAEQTTPLEMGSRRGLFARDTVMVLDHLENQVPLYVSPAASVAALRVADAARRSAETGQTIDLAS